MTGSLQPQLMSFQDLFAGSLFAVPDYQRAYAWEQKQWDDLWEDIREGMRTATPHFLGTVVLMAQDEPHRDSEGRILRVFQLVDGQQRLITLCLLLLAMYDRVRQDHDGIARGLWRDFLEHEHGLPKLRPSGLNADYFDELVASVQDGRQLPSDQRSTNGRLQRALRRFRDLIEGWVQAEGERTQLPDLASYMREKLQVLRFATDSRPLAIKTFQTVNDRGKDLSLLDKTKSFLMFYVTRYLEDEAEVFQAVEQTFGRVFDNYDALKDLAAKFSVDYLVNPRFRFNEDEFLRYAYHYGAKDFRSRYKLQSGYEYGITPERVFDGFIKGACRELRNQPDALRQFVLEWGNDLAAVSEALVSMLERIPEDAAYDRLFRFQGPNASVYPLLVAAEARGFLDDDMLRAISILDLRVYQVRGTDPRADLYRNAVSETKTGDRSAIHKTIVRYCREFGSDHELDSVLRGHVYRQSFTKYVLWQYVVAPDREVNELDFELYADCQVEHVFPDDPSTLDVTTFGFNTDEDYEATKHSFGNLTVLESELNNRARNRPPGEKGPIYCESRLASNRVIGARMAEADFTRDGQNDRMEDIVRFFKQRWPIPVEVS